MVHHRCVPAARRNVLRHSLLGLILLVALFPQLHAQTTGSGITAPEKAYSRFVLDHGLEVVIVQNHLVPIATLELATRNGSFTEGPEYAGLSHLYEHMFFKANNKYPSGEAFSAVLSANGIIFNATTREEVVYYYFTLPIENLEKGMEIMSGAAQFPAFDVAELEREREVVIGEFDRHESNPFFAFNRAMDEALWGDVVTRKQPIGQRPVIKTATPEKMRFIQKKYYIPNNCALIVAGDVDSASVHQLAEKYFGNWEEGKNPFEKDPPPMAKPLTQKKLVTVPAAVDVAQVEYRFHGPSIGIDNAATYAADVFLFITRQPQSRFQRKLVESGLAQGAGMGYYTQRYVGPIQVEAVCAPENIKKLQEALWEEIQAFDSPDYFTDEELETAKAILHVDHLYDSEETTDWAHTLSFWWSTTGLDYFRGYLDNLSKVTREDIQRYIRTYVKGKNYVLGITSNQQALNNLNLNKSEVLK